MKRYTIAFILALLASMFLFSLGHADTATFTATMTSTSTGTATATNTATFTSTRTRTRTPTITKTYTKTYTYTWTYTYTYTATAPTTTRTSTRTRTATATTTPTRTSTVTATVTTTPTQTFTETANLASNDTQGFATCISTTAGISYIILPQDNGSWTQYVAVFQPDQPDSGPNWQATTQVIISRKTNKVTLLAIDNSFRPVNCSVVNICGSLICYRKNNWTH